ARIGISRGNEAEKHREAVMRVRYFALDRRQQLWKASQAAVEGIWDGTRPPSDLGLDLGDRLALATVLCDDDLRPKVCYVLRLDVVDDAVTEDSRVLAYEAATEGNRRNLSHPSARRQSEGWPADWKHQLAVAIDAPLAALRRVGVGGPLPLADMLGVSRRDLLRYFEEALRG
ncbi:MAG: hypothetical protein ACRC1K_20365, partial [Planctomycetia bacterium]